MQVRTVVDCGLDAGWWVRRVDLDGVWFVVCVWLWLCGCVDVWCAGVYCKVCSVWLRVWAWVWVWVELWVGVRKGMAF